MLVLSLGVLAQVTWVFVKITATQGKITKYGSRILNTENIFEDKC